MQKYMYAEQNTNTYIHCLCTIYMPGIQTFQPQMHEQHVCHHPSHSSTPVE